MAPSLLAFPRELTLLLLEYCDLNSTIRVAGVCRVLRELVLTTKDLLYNIGYMFGYKNGLYPKIEAIPATLKELFSGYQVGAREKKLKEDSRSKRMIRAYWNTRYAGEQPYTFYNGDGEEETYDIVRR